MKVRVNVAELETFAARLADQSPLWKQIAAFADGKLQQTQSAGQDPYGSTWAAKADGSASFLRDRGELEASRNFTSTSSSATVSFGARHAVFHQEGTRYMVARKLVPDSLPPAWQAPIEAIATAWASSL